MTLIPPIHQNTETITIYLFDFNPKTASVDPFAIKRTVKLSRFNEFFPNIFERPIQYFSCESFNNIPQDYKTDDFKKHLEACRYLCSKEPDPEKKELNIKQVRKILFDLCRRNYAPALNLLSAAYRSGALGLQRNNQMALLQLKATSKRGLAAATHQIGRAYEFELLGLQINLQKAFEHYQLAASQGYSEAQYVIGWAYANKGLKRKLNHSLAIKYYQQAAELKNPEALYQLGFAHESGSLGVNIDLKIAFFYYKKAAKRHHIYALARINSLNGDESGLMEDTILQNDADAAKSDSKRSHSSDIESHPKRIRIRHKQE